MVDNSSRQITKILHENNLLPLFFSFENSELQKGYKMTKNATATS